MKIINLIIIKPVLAILALLGYLFGFIIEFISFGVMLLAQNLERTSVDFLDKQNIRIGKRFHKGRA